MEREIQPKVVRGLLAASAIGLALIACRDKGQQQEIQPQTEPGRTHQGLNFAPVTSALSTEPTTASLQETSGSASGPDPNRADCSVISGTDYNSDAERSWFLSNCRKPTAPTKLENAVTVERNVSLSAQEQALINAINQSRVEHNLSPLPVDPELMAVARGRTSYMTQSGQFAHLDAEQRIQSLCNNPDQNTYYWGAEILGRNNDPVDPIVRVIEGWLKSPDHREIILEPWAVIAVATNPGADGLTYFAAIFTKGHCRV